MNKRGSKPKGKVKIVWSAHFAYAIGLIVTDGNISKDGRRITFVSKDYEQVKNFVDCFGIENKIGRHMSGSTDKISYRVQFGDVRLIAFLDTIGIMPAKSKIIGPIHVPDKFFFSYLLGCFDGDGTIHSYYDKRWKSSFMFYTIFCSASKKHIVWLRARICTLLGIKGHITKSKNSSVYQLKYAKNESVILLKALYFNTNSVCLNRKRLKINKILAIVGES